MSMLKYARRIPEIIAKRRATPVPCSCGSVPKIVEDATIDNELALWRVMCPNRKCNDAVLQGKVYHSRLEAIAAWNDVFIDRAKRMPTWSPQ